MYQMAGEKPLRADPTSKKLQLLTTPWLSVEGEWSHHCVNFASSYKMGNVHSCAVIWLFIAFFFSATSIGWSCWCIRWGKFAWSNNVLFIWGTYHLSELTGRISQFANRTRKLWGTESCFWPKRPCSGRMTFWITNSSLRWEELKPPICELAGSTGQVWPFLSAL